MVRVALVALLITTFALCVVPPTKILAGTMEIKVENIEFTSVTSTNGPHVYKALFGGIFTVVPGVGLISTGFSYAPMTSAMLFGWDSSLSRITQDGATITVTPMYAFNYIKLKWMAAQGDHIQVFYITANVLAPTIPASFLQVPFDYTKVNFDSDNLPS